MPVEPPHPPGRAALHHSRHQPCIRGRVFLGEESGDTPDLLPDGLRRVGVDPGQGYQPLNRRIRHSELVELTLALLHLSTPDVQLSEETLDPVALREGGLRG